MEDADILVLAIIRAFPGFDPGEAPVVADALRVGTVQFAPGELTLERGFEYTATDAAAYLAGMGDWRQPLLAGIDTRIRSLRWDPDHNFLYVYRVA